MRIGFFSETYLPEIHGVTISMESFRKTLEAMGHEVFIFAPEAPDYTDKNPNVFRFKAAKMIEKPRLYHTSLFLPVGCEFKEVERIRLDIVHTQTPFSMGLLAKYFSASQRIPMVYTHHTHYPEYAKVYLKEKVILPYGVQVYSKWFCNTSNAVIAPSLKMEKLLRGYGVKKDIPIYILPTGIDLKIFKPSSEAGKELRRKLNIPDETKVLLFVGRMSGEKNVEFLIDAFIKVLERRKDVFLLMVGDGKDLDKFKKKVNHLNIDGSVIFTGNVSHEKIPDYYQASDVFLFASLADTQGIILEEAIACGLPVVVLKDDAFDGVVEDGENGIAVKEQTPESFALSILDILEPLAYRKFSGNTLKSAANFSEEYSAAKLVQIYQNTIKNYREVQMPVEDSELVSKIPYLVIDRILYSLFRLGKGKETC